MIWDEAWGLVGRGLGGGMESRGEIGREGGREGGTLFKLQHQRRYKPECCNNTAATTS